MDVSKSPDQLSQSLLGLLITTFLCTHAIGIEQYPPRLPPYKMAMITTNANGHSSRSTGSQSTALSLPSHKVNVRVGDTLTRQEAAVAAAATSPSMTRSVPPSLAIGRGFRSTSVGLSPNKKEFPSPQMAIIKVKSTEEVSGKQLRNQGYASSRSVVNEDLSWPPEHSQEFARVNVRVLGERIDHRALMHLGPSSTQKAIRKLRKILGKHFESEWMSLVAPRKTLEDSGKTIRSAFTLKLPQPSKHLQNAVNSLNFTVLRRSKDSNVAIPVVLMPQQIELMREWLLQSTTCKIDYIWEDLGPLFWPRWIRRGICANSVCQWPPGMRCHPGESKSLNILRWVCSNDSQGQSDARIRWRRGGQGGRLYTWLQRSRRRFTREEKRSRRVRRLMEKLSVSADGYYCKWAWHQYIVTENCVCGCG